LEGFAWKGRDLLHLAGKLFLRETAQIVEESPALTWRNAIEIALGSADEPQVLRDFASHAGSLST